MHQSVYTFIIVFFALILIPIFIVYNLYYICTQHYNVCTYHHNNLLLALLLCHKTKNTSSKPHKTPFKWFVLSVVRVCARRSMLRNNYGFTVAPLLRYDFYHIKFTLISVSSKLHSPATCSQQNILCYISEKTLLYEEKANSTS